MKKSYRKIPENIIRDIRACNHKPFVIFAVRKLAKGSALPNIPGLIIGDDQVSQFSSLPDPSLGTWARRNVYGWEIVLKNEPLITKTFTHESPNFGDWSLGSHEVSQSRDVYQRIVFPGHASTIKVTEIARDDEHVTLGFELEHIFASVPSDEREFLFALNVFQESVGSSAVRPTDSSIDSYVSSLQIDWEILPVGERDEVIRQVNARLNPTPKEAKEINERLDLLLSLKPRDFITGSSGFARYVGARYGDKLVAFENIRYGNALYVMFDDWERLSRMSRIQLMTSEEKFERIIHRQGWEKVVKAIINEYKPYRY